MAYSTVGDLLLGDLRISSSVDQEKFVNDAAEEMDAKLGYLYTLPLTDLPTHQELLLKHINNKLASGRLILTLDIAGEGTALHAYGLRLITEAMNDLMLLANGTVDLDADLVVVVDPTDKVGTMVPSVKNIDEESGVEAFTERVMRGENTWWWTPGKVS